MTTKKRPLPFDDELALIAGRKANALDLLCRCLVEIDTLTSRADVLLDRRRAAESPAEQTQEFPAVREDIPPDQMT